MSQNFQNTTPKQQRKIILYDQKDTRYFFPLWKDKDLGISRKYQDLLIESWNDDDKKTSTTQLRRGMDQTINDLFDVLGSQEEESLNSE